MKYSIIIGVFVLLQGCGSILDMQMEVSEKGAEAANNSLLAGIFLVCDGSSTGAVRREFNTELEYKVWRAFCKATDK